MKKKVAIDIVRDGLQCFSKTALPALSLTLGEKKVVYYVRVYVIDADKGYYHRNRSWNCITPAIVKRRRYDELTDAKKLREACDIKSINIVLQGLPQDIYNLVNHYEKAKHIWDRVKLFIEGSEISL
ncbi:hypothetical protein Tco_0617241 [Tanacetum coccineum]